MKKILLLILFFFILLNLHAQEPIAEPIRTFQSVMRRFTEVFQMVDLNNYTSARIEIKATNAEELFSNNNDRYLIVAFPVPERSSFTITIYFRDAQIVLAMIFDNSNFTYKLPDQLNEIYELYQNIAIILWQSS